MYEKLSKIFYKNESKYIDEYEKRIADYATFHLPLEITHYQTKEKSRCFYVNHTHLAMQQEHILQGSRLIRELMRQLPPKVIEDYIRGKLIDEIVNTNEIEGVQSTRVEILGVYVQLKKSRTPRKMRFSNIVASYQYLLDSNFKNRISSFAEIREIFDHIVSEDLEEGALPDGELFRKEGVEVVTATQKVLHKGVATEGEIALNLKAMIEFLNNSEYPVLARIAISHYYFGYIHPFYDGNGRTSRYISSIYLKRELDVLTAMTLSFATNHYKKQYYEGFNDANNRLNKGELTFFCETFFDILIYSQESVIDELRINYRKLRVLQEALEDYKTLMTEVEMNALYIVGQSYIYNLEGSGITKQELEEECELSSHKMTQIINTLLEQDHIQKIKQRPFTITLSDKMIESVESI